MTAWKRYINDAIAYIKTHFAGYVLLLFQNSFHNKIKFIYEEEHNNKVSFLDDSVVRKNGKTQTTVYRKSTHNKAYLHWDIFVSDTLKRGTFERLLLRAPKVSSEEAPLQKETEHLKRGFENINGYCKWITKRIPESVQSNLSHY